MTAPSAARFLVLRDDGVEAVDLVGELLALDPRTKLRSRDGDLLRRLADAAAGLLELGAVCASGAELVEVLVVDEATRERVVPSLDPSALLDPDGPGVTRMDRTIRLAEAMTERAAAHRAGEVDLAAAVAPPGPDRHPRAATLEATVAVAVDGVDLPAVAAPAIVTAEAGWVAVSPYELLLTVGRGDLAGDDAAVAGEALARWFDGWTRGPDAWRRPLLDRMAVDADGLLHDAAARAGSDHPVVIGPVVAELVAMRHPIA